MPLITPPTTMTKWLATLLALLLAAVLTQAPQAAGAEGAGPQPEPRRAPASSPEVVPFAGSFRITATWGSPSGGYHADSTPAIDTAMPIGTPIYAAGTGRVSFTAVDNRNCNPNTYPGGVTGCINAGYAGTRIYVAHPDGTTSRYIHLSAIAGGIGTGVNVGAGQLLGYSGNSGTSTGPHLHYEERNSAGNYINPGNWTACHGASPVTYDNMQNRKGQTIRNDGYGCSTGGGGGGIGNGSFVAHAGNVYRIAGGAPLYVSTWNVYGGPQPTTGLSDAQFAALAPYPADGTTVDTQTGAVYVFVGGAPLYVTNWDAIGGPRPSIRVDQFALDNAGAPAPLDHSRRYPVDGTAVSGHDGAVYIFAGGAPLYVTNFDNIGGPRAATRVDQAALDNGGNDSYPWGHVRKFPLDGTTVSAHEGAVYMFAGGAPLYVSNWDAVGGPRPTTRVDQAPLDNAGNNSFPWGHVSKYPTDGTTVGSSTGHVYTFAGGAPLYVSAWAAIGGERAAIPVDGHTLAQGGVQTYPFGHVARYPLNGTVLSANGQTHSWVVANGAATVTTRKAGVVFDENAARHAGLGLPWNHLRSATPRATLANVPVTTRTSSITVKWTRHLTASTTTAVDLRWRKGTGRWITPSTWVNMAGTSARLTGLDKGKTYCFSLRARNLAEQSGSWSAPDCVRRR